MLQIGQVYKHPVLGDIKITEIAYDIGKDEFIATFREQNKDHMYASMGSVSSLERAFKGGLNGQK